MTTEHNQVMWVMARSCSTCAHPRVAFINDLLLQGIPYRDIVTQAGFPLVSPSSLMRHRVACLQEEIAAYAKISSEALLEKAETMLDSVFAEYLAAPLDSKARIGNLTLSIIKHLSDIQARARRNMELLGVRQVRNRADVFGALTDVTNGMTAGTISSEVAVPFIKALDMILAILNEQDGLESDHDLLFQHMIDALEPYPAARQSVLEAVRRQRLAAPVIEAAVAAE